MKRYSAEPTQVKKDTAGTADPSLPSAKDATHGEKSHQEDADTAETYTHTEAVSPAEPEVPGNTATPPAPEADPQAHPPKTRPHNDKELAALAEAREKREMLEEYLATVQADLTNSASREAERKKAIYEEVKRLNSRSAEEQQAYFESIRSGKMLDDFIEKFRTEAKTQGFSDIVIETYIELFESLVSDPESMAIQELEKLRAHGFEPKF